MSSAKRKFSIVTVVAVALGTLVVLAPYPIEAFASVLVSRRTPSALPCLPDTALEVESLRETIAYYTESDDAEAVAVRARWGVSQLPLDSVLAVADSLLCARGLAVHVDSLPNQQNVLDRVAAVRFGHVLAIHRAWAEIMFGHAPVLIMDSTATTTVELFWP